ncbi:MAG: hypothetical protein ACYC9S_13775 [Leptospirales bacterium]
MKTTFESDLKEIECDGIELEEIGRESARIARMRNDIYRDLLDEKKVGLLPNPPG